MENLIENITNALKTVKYPGFSRDIVSFGIIKKISVDPQNNLLIQASLNTDNDENVKKLKDDICKVLSDKFSFNSIDITINNQENNKEEDSKSKIKKIIAVSSCKGGVGKSTIALNLAYELSRNNKVGLLDLDIYGPSLPTLINHNEQPEINNDIIIPVDKYGLKCMSFGFINNENSPTIWRGPMVSRMTQQFFDNVQWGELDYLILDLPPGTGDIQLTLVQKINLSGAVIVTTPQDLSHVDVKKGSDMFKKVNTPIIGIIENMSGLVLSGNLNIKSASDLELSIENKKIDIDNEGNFNFCYDIFKGTSGNLESERLGLPLLGKIHIDKNISDSCDKGVPFVKQYEGSFIQKEFKEIAEKIK